MDKGQPHTLSKRRVRQRSQRQTAGETPNIPCYLWDRQKRTWYTVIVDEGHKFVDKSHESFSNILPETLKYRLNIVFAHQYLKQLQGLEAALGMAAKVFFRAANDEDGTYSARELHMYDPFEVHRPAATDKSVDKDYLPNEAFTKGSQKLRSLTQRNAIIRIENWNEEIKTLKIPPRKTSKEDLQKLIASYAKLLMTPVADLVPATPVAEKPRYRDLLATRKGLRPSDPSSSL